MEYSYQIDWCCLRFLQARGSLLLDRFLELVEGCHPGDRVDEIDKRVTLFAQGTHGRTHGVFPSRAARYICIRAVEGKVSLVQFAEQVAIVPKDLSALLH